MANFLSSNPRFQDLMMMLFKFTEAQTEELCNAKRLYICLFLKQIKIFTLTHFYQILHTPISFYNYLKKMFC